MLVSVIQNPVVCFSTVFVVFQLFLFFWCGGAQDAWEYGNISLSLRVIMTTDKSLCKACIFSGSHDSKMLLEWLEDRLFEGRSKGCGLIS